MKSDRERLRIGLLWPHSRYSSNVNFGTLPRVLQYVDNMQALICKNYLQSYQVIFISSGAGSESWLAPGTAVQIRRPAVSVLAAAVPKFGTQTRLRGRATTVPVQANIVIGTSRLVQLDRVEEPVRILKGVRVAGSERGAGAFHTAARRHGLPGAVVDHGAAEVGVDDDGLLLEVVAHAAPAVGRLEVGRRRAPGLWVGRPAGQICGHRGFGPRPDPEAVVL